MEWWWWWFCSLLLLLTVTSSSAEAGVEGESGSDDDVTSFRLPPSTDTHTHTRIDRKQQQTEAHTKHDLFSGYGRLLPACGRAPMTACLPA